jgi:hypothetical protein
VVHAFNCGVVTLHTPLPTADAVDNPYHTFIDGADSYLGIIRAEAIPAGQLQGSVLSGKGYYDLNISMFDAKTKFAITDPQARANEVVGQHARL